MDARCGDVTDRLALEGDFVPLSHNSGLSTCGDRLAVLGLRSQTLKLLQARIPRLSSGGRGSYATLSSPILELIQSRSTTDDVQVSAVNLKSS